MADHITQNSDSKNIQPEVVQITETSIENLSHIYCLNKIKGFGPQKFLHLARENISAEEIINNPKAASFSGKEGQTLISKISKINGKDLAECKSLATRQIAAAKANQAYIITIWDKSYPVQLIDSRYPAPILYAKGNVNLLQEDKAIACVGSRKVRDPYAALMQSFCETAVKNGHTIVSGFATGADRISHEAALRSNGNTIMVFAGGVNRPFPPENLDLWKVISDYRGALTVSEAPFSTGASSLLLRRRNRLIVALSQAVLIGQSAEKGGAMNSFKFAMDQNKPIATFKHDNQEDSGGNKVIEEHAQADTTSFLSTRPEQKAWKEWISRRSYLI